MTLVYPPTAMRTETAPRPSLVSITSVSLHSVNRTATALLVPNVEEDAASSHNAALEMQSALLANDVLEASVHLKDVVLIVTVVMVRYVKQDDVSLTVVSTTLTVDLRSSVSQDSVSLISSAAVKMTALEGSHASTIAVE